MPPDLPFRCALHDGLQRAPVRPRCQGRKGEPMTITTLAATAGADQHAMKANGQPERWIVAARLSRVTKKNRERGDSLINGIQTQDLAAAEWAQAEGHEIVAVTKDRNVSGVIPPERPELGPWLTEPDKLVQYDGIVAHAVDRLSRRYQDVTWLRDWAERNGKKLYVIKDRLRWPDERDGMLWAVPPSVPTRSGATSPSGSRVRTTRSGPRVSSWAARRSATPSRARSTTNASCPPGRAGSMSR